MTSASARFAVSVLALILVSGAAAAASSLDGRERKATFFEQLFGSSGPSASEIAAQDRKRRRNLLGRKWWNSDDGIRIINNRDFGGFGSNRYVFTDDDPEGDPGFGMGNLTYVPDKTVALGGLKFDDPQPVLPEAAAIYDTLTGGDLNLRVRPEIRDAISAQYARQGFRPIWTAGSALSPRATALLKTLAAADAEGLIAEEYRPTALSSFDAPAPAYDPAAMARLDVELTAVALKYVHDASGGRFDPRRLSRYNDVTPEWASAEKGLKVLAWSPFPAEYLASLNPTHPAYAAMKAALAEERGNAGDQAFAPIPEGPVIKPGMSDRRIEAIRRRLDKLGHVQLLVAADDPMMLDDGLVEQVRQFQKAAGIHVDGVIGNQTIGALNGDHSERNVARLLDNMERLRWLPKDLGGRYVFVNQAAFEVRVMDHGNEVWKSKVIVGKPMTQTAAFHDEIETVVFNPSWGVPPSIIANEYLPRLRDDPDYLDRIGFQVTDARGNVIPSGSIDWWMYGNKVPYDIKQPPGRSNALGELKFLFPNSHNIYMHDTPSRRLFDRDVRAFSHGCVRVQNPREFASILLGWNAAKVSANTDSRNSRSVRLPAKVPVHITYFTAWPDETGKIRYFNDLYRRDKTMENARSTLTMAER